MKKLIKVTLIVAALALAGSAVAPAMGGHTVAGNSGHYSGHYSGGGPRPA